MAMFTNQMRFTGISGLEVNDMVSQLMRAHSVRLDRMRQQRDIFSWQRDAMRVVASDLRTFRGNFLDFGANAHQNVRSVSNFNAVNTNIVNRNNPASTVRGITVTNMDSNDLRPRRVEVESVARGDVFRSAFSLNQPITAVETLDLNFLDAPGGFSMTVDLNGRPVVINIERHEIQAIITGGPGTANQRFVELFNQRLNAAFGSDTGGQYNPDGLLIPGSNDTVANRQHVWASLTDDGTSRLVINARSGNTVSISNGTPGGGHGHAIGQAGFVPHMAPDGTMSDPTTAFDPNTMSTVRFLNNQQQFDFTINGVQFAFNGISLTVRGPADEHARSVLNTVDPTGLTVQDVINAVNNSDAGVRMSFSEATGRMTMESTSVGAAAGRITFEDNFGGFLQRAGFGANHEVMATSRIQGGALGFNANNMPIRGDALFDPTLLTPTDTVSFRVTLNGLFLQAQDINFTVAGTGAGGAFLDDAEFLTALNTQLDLAIANVISVAPPTNIASIDGDGRLVFNIPGHHISISAVSGSDYTLDDLGFAPPSSGLNFRTNTFSIQHTQLQDIMTAGTFPPNTDIDILDSEGISVFSGNFGPNATLADINAAMAGANLEFRFDVSTGRFALVSTDPNVSLNNFTLDDDLFTYLGLGANRAQYHSAARTRIANDAVVYVDGQRFVRASNTLEVDGIRIVLDQSLNVPAEGLDLDVTFERDIESVMQLIRDFVDGFNELISSIRQLTETPRPRQTGGAGFFMPLTDEQRREMSDREIELWEEQARTGLMHRNHTLRQLTTELHRAMFQDVRLQNGGTINLLHIGIRTHSDLERFGELQIDEDRVRAWVTERGSDVTELFTNFSDIPAGTEPNPARTQRIAESGLGQRINDLIHWQLSFGGGLFSQAGAVSHEGNPSRDNFMDRRIAAEDLRIDNQIRILQRREARYFQIFSRLEAAMIQANSQMMFFEQMFWMA